MNWWEALVYWGNADILVGSAGIYEKALIYPRKALINPKLRP